MARTVALTGKGGVGKTTIAALIVRHLRDHGLGPVLALDADTDCNLASLLGITVETTIGDLREDLLRNIRDLPAGMSKENYIQAGLHQIVVETPGVDLITMGRGEGPGCYCFINHVLRKFAEELTGSYQWVVMDNEAGMEHLSRRTASRIDRLIVVVNANPLSTDAAMRIDRLLGELGQPVGNRYYLLNGVPDARVSGVRDAMAAADLEYLGAVPHDDAIEEAVFRRESVYALEDSPVPGIISRIMQKIGVG